MRRLSVTLDYSKNTDGGIIPNSMNISSTLFRLSKSDAVKGLVMAVIGAVISTIYQALVSNADISVSLIGYTAATAGLGYLVKNFFSDEDGKVFGVVG